MDTQETKNTPETKPEQKPKGCSCFSACFNAGRACKSKTFKIITAIVGLILIILVSFAGGVAVGLHKARFSYRWGENYERNFMGPGSGGMNDGMRGFFRNFEGRDFRNAHGLAGTIISIADNNLVIKDKDNKESTVAVTDKTIIKSGRDNIELGGLKQNDQIVVIGNPGDNGVINASLIRIFVSN